MFVAGSISYKQNKTSTYTDLNGNNSVTLGCKCTKSTILPKYNTSQKGMKTKIH